MLRRRSAKAGSSVSTSTTSAELEIHERRRRRIERYLKDSNLLSEETLGTLSRTRLTLKVAKVLPTVCESVFVARGDNLLAFGLPGSKAHLVCAIGTS